MNVESMDRKVENTEATIEKKINEGLSDMRPVGIGYCTDFIKYNKLRLIYNTSETTRRPQSNCGEHASIIVGSQKVKDSCQYMIKNTWGSSYWARKNACYCEHKTTKKKYNNCFKESHPLSEYNVLGCWFDSTDVIANTFDVISVK